MAKEARTYKKVLAQMLEMIHTGVFPAGGRLPPERELAERFDVSRPTIREAIIALETLEYVEVKTGSGVYVIENSRMTSGTYDDVSAFELTESRALRSWWREVGFELDLGGAGLTGLVNSDRKRTRDVG